MSITVNVPETPPPPDTNSPAVNFETPVLTSPTEGPIEVVKYNFRIPYSYRTPNRNSQDIERFFNPVPFSTPPIVPETSPPVKNFQTMLLPSGRRRNTGTILSSAVRFNFTTSSTPPVPFSPDPPVNISPIPNGRKKREHWEVHFLLKSAMKIYSAIRGRRQPKPNEKFTPAHFIGDKRKKRRLIPSPSPGPTDGSVESQPVPVNEQSSLKEVLLEVISRFDGGLDAAAAFFSEDNAYRFYNTSKKTPATTEDVITFFNQIVLKGSSTMVRNNQAAVRKGQMLS
eukprot:gene10576-22069_t